MNPAGMVQSINVWIVQLGVGRILWVSGILTLAGLTLAAFRRVRIAGLVVAACGLAVLAAGLFAVTLLEIRERVSPNLIVERFYYPPSTRQLALYGLAFLAGITLITIRAWRRSYRRIRLAKLPIHLKQGLRAFFQKENEVALKEYTLAISIDRDRAETYNRRGQVYFQMGDLTRALADFDKAIDLAPEVANSYRMRGSVHARHNNYDQALNDYEFALKLDPADCASILGRGICFARLGRTQLAIEELRRVLRLTNHSDYADPAKEYLRNLGVDE